MGAGGTAHHGAPWTEAATQGGPAAVSGGWAVPPPVVAGLRLFLGGWLGIGASSAWPRRAMTSSSPGTGGRLAGDVLPGRPGALRHAGGRVGVGARAVGRGAVGGVREPRAARPRGSV